MMHPFEYNEADVRLYNNFLIHYYVGNRILNPKAGSMGELQRVRNAYLDLMEACLVGGISKDGGRMAGAMTPYHPKKRESGWDWPMYSHSMIGMKRMNNLRTLTESVIGNNIPGDFIETGVWRGGACILMRAVLSAYHILDRRVWVADSFAGLPEPDETKYPEDTGSSFHQYVELTVSLEEVRQNFASYGLLDDQVQFLQGWFKDTLPTVPVAEFALIRLDGDMYESTMDALVHLYPKLSQGGYAIIDDYHVVPACKQAVHDYCTMHSIEAQFIEIDGVGIYWQKV